MLALLFTEVHLLACATCTSPSLTWHDRATLSLPATGQYAKSLREGKPITHQVAKHVAHGHDGGQRGRGLPSCDTCARGLGHYSLQRSRVLCGRRPRGHRGQGGIHRHCKHGQEGGRGGERVGEKQ
jgi:hypothetical protein